MSADHSDTAPFLFELSGEHPSLPMAEVLACVAAECTTFSLQCYGPGYVIIRIRSDEIDPVAKRLALTHRLGRLIGEAQPSGDIVLDQQHVKDGSVALRIKRFQRFQPEIDVDTLTRKVGATLTQNRKVDLEDPDFEFRGFISDRSLFYVKTHEIDRSQFEQRAVKERPYFSPISLHPRLARALVNLSGVRRGELVLDPFCGTGGILIEAAILGAKTLGSDLSPKMIDGCAQNMEHFGLKPDRLLTLDIGSVHDAFGEVDAVVTDPPYGRSTSTNKEVLGDLYARSMEVLARTLKPGRRMGIAFPREVKTPDGLELVETHVQRVHRSLDRRYCVFIRNAASDVHREP
jgi:tRNA (guanine10-N2)-dimethyltransferase